ncbi:MAG: hypothetical protein WD065_12230 [Planctomycetaceae bacterium]
MVLMAPFVTFAEQTGRLADGSRSRFSADWRLAVRCILCLLFLSTVGIAGDVDYADVATRVKEANENREAYYKIIEDELDRVKKGKVNPRLKNGKNDNAERLKTKSAKLYNKPMNWHTYAPDLKKPVLFADKTMKDEIVKAIEKDIEREKRRAESATFNGNFYGSLYSEGLKVGEYGMLPTNLSGGTFVFQVIDKNSMLIKSGDFIMVKDYATDDLVDGKNYNIKTPFICTGTTTYKTITGSNTVYVLEPLDVKKVEDKLK